MTWCPRWRQLLQTLYDAMDYTDRTALETLLTSCDMQDILGIRLDRELAQADNL